VKVIQQAWSVQSERRPPGGNLTARVKISTRIQISLIALAAMYLVGAVSVGLRFRDIRISLLFLFWSIPFFAVGWLVTGIPLIAVGDLVLRLPAIVVVVGGAGAGLFVLLLMPLIDWVEVFIRTTPGMSRSIALPWSYLMGWPTLCAALGAGGTFLYRRLLSRRTR
jgi:hypothetical protein